MTTTTGSKPSSKRRTRAKAIAAVAIIAALVGAWQVDLVRQNAQILWLTITGRRWHVHGDVRPYYVYSPALRQSRLVYVYTPQGYDDAVNRRLHYAVVYLLHGSPGGPTDWLRYGRAPELVERLVAAKRLPPMVVVCPDGQGIGRLGDSEYIDAPSAAGPKGDPAGVDVGDFIWRDLPAWVDSHFRSKRDPAWRILGGASSGGYGAVNLSLQHPDVFGAGLSYSGYFTASPFGWARPVWGSHPDQARLNVESPSTFVDGPRPQWHNSFIYIGDGLDERPPYPQQAAAFVERLQAAHIDYRYERLPGKHSWDVWRTLLTNSLTDYAAKRSLAPSI